MFFFFSFLYTSEHPSWHRNCHFKEVFFVFNSYSGSSYSGLYVNGSTNTMTVRFSSDSSYSQQGFYISYYGSTMNMSSKSFQTFASTMKGSGKITVKQWYWHLHVLFHPTKLAFLLRLIYEIGKINWSNNRLILRWYYYQSVAKKYLPQPWLTF